ncbi:unnamed protein product [Leptidea sinapis]|uniref:ZAD domain-containing protein n=1 Tax=Leptidea sinapis TaxID=189913 RepID=A0A5E4PND7_9NEOP|nr:unnamed protein product [Leptidea sinapis]
MNSKMYRINDTNLLEVYDKITCKLDICDMSVYMCYMCKSMLHKCYKLMIQASKAQEIMKEYLDTKVLPTSLHQEFYNLSVNHNNKVVDITVNMNELQEELFIKQEIKEELVEIELERNTCET